MFQPQFSILILPFDMYDLTFFSKHETERNTRCFTDRFSIFHDKDRALRNTSILSAELGYYTI